MTSPHDPLGPEASGRGRAGREQAGHAAPGPEPSELVAAFRLPAVRLDPPPGTYAALRRRATARRRRRALAMGTAVTACLAGAAGLLAMTLPGREGDPTPAPPAASTEESPADATPTPENTAPPEPTESVAADPVPEEPGPAVTGPSPADSASLARCASAELAAALAPQGAGAGSVFYTLTLTNTGERGCLLAGYPGVSLVTAEDGAQLGAPATRGSERGEPARLALAPGDSAVADLRLAAAGNYPAEDCAAEEAGGLRVHPPDERTALFVPAANLTGCANEDVELLSVTVLYR